MTMGRRSSLALFALLVPSTATVSALDPAACLNPANEIVAENCLPGAPR